MFVVERFFTDFDSREEAYEKRMEKWIREGEADGYNYRTKNDFIRKFGDSPKDKAITISRKVAFILACAFTVFAMTQLISVEVQENNNQSQEVKE